VGKWRCSLTLCGARHRCKLGQQGRVRVVLLLSGGQEVLSLSLGVHVPTRDAVMIYSLPNDLGEHGFDVVTVYGDGEDNDYDWHVVAEPELDGNGRWVFDADAVIGAEGLRAVSPWRRGDSSLGMTLMADVQLRIRDQEL